MDLSSEPFICCLIFGRTRAHSFALLTKIPGGIIGFTVCSMPAWLICGPSTVERGTNLSIASLRESEKGGNNTTWKDGSGPDCLLVNAKY